MRDETGDAVEEVVAEAFEGDFDAGAETGDVVASADGLVVQDEGGRVVEAVGEVVEEGYWRCDFISRSLFSWEGGHTSQPRRYQGHGEMLSVLRSFVSLTMLRRPIVTWYRFDSIRSLYRTPLV